MVGADHPDGAVGLQDAPALGEPGAREAVVVGEAGELVPGVVDAVDHACCWGAAGRARAADCRADRRRRDRRSRRAALPAPPGNRRRGRGSPRRPGQRNSQPPGHALTQGHGTQLAVTQLGRQSSTNCDSSVAGRTQLAREQWSLREKGCRPSPRSRGHPSSSPPFFWSAVKDGRSGGCPASGGAGAGPRSRSDSLPQPPPRRHRQHVDDPCRRARRSCGRPC